MLVDHDSPPEETIYYLACCVLELLKDGQYSNIEELQNDLHEKFDIKSDHSSFFMSLNFLFLINRISVTPEEIKCI